MDFAILQFIVAVLRKLVSEEIADYRQQLSPSTESLASLFAEVVRHGREVMVNDPVILAALGRRARPGCVGRILEDLFDACSSPSLSWADSMAFILERGSLAERLRSAVGRNPGRAQLYPAYEKLAHCLAHGEPFLP